MCPLLNNLYVKWFIDVLFHRLYFIFSFCVLCFALLGTLFLKGWLVMYMKMKVGRRHMYGHFQLSQNR